MKMYLGNVPIKSMNVHHFERDTNDATMVASDLQAGVTAYARGQKITGTGKCFEFAMYGNIPLNYTMPIPTTINVVEIASTVYPVRSILSFTEVLNTDFSSAIAIAEIVVNGTVYPITLQVANNMMTISCSYSSDIEIFYGKDRYL